MSTLGIVLVALAIAIGLVGIVVPVQPGGLLVFAAIAVWAGVEHTAVSWATLGVATALFVGTEAIKYLRPVRRMRAAEVGTWSLIVGGVLGVIGFFVIPVLGLVSRSDARRAWVSTVHALIGVVLSGGFELSGALLATLAWVAGLVFTN